MSTYQPLSCDLYDYLEIACMHGYHLRVELIDGTNLQAQALTTRTNAQKEEFFCLQGDDGPLEIRLDQLLAITPSDPQASFGRIELAGHFCSL
ncbi:MAG: Rho-binding antiterminator [Pseudomonas sp.]